MTATPPNGAYVVEEVIGTPRLWENPKGGTIAYDTIRFTGVEKPVELGRKQDKPAPSPGESLNLKDFQWDERFPNKFKAKKEFAQAGGGGFAPLAEDPKRSAVILRQHSQEMALRYAAIRAHQGKLPDGFTIADLFSIADFFDKDAQRAKDAA